MSRAASPYAKRIVRALMDDMTSTRGLTRHLTAGQRAEWEERWCEIVDEELKGSLL